jgi:hypothetical protein
VRATRIGDVGAGVEIADPARDAKRVPRAQESWRGWHDAVFTFVAEGIEPFTQHFALHPTFFGYY